MLHLIFFKSKNPILNQKFLPTHSPKNPAYDNFEYLNKIFEYTCYGNNFLMISSHLAIES